MRTLNIRLALVLLAIMVVLGGGVYWLHAYQVERNAYVFLEQADRAEEQAKKAAEEGNDWLQQQSMQETIRNLSWYVRLMPDESEVRERLGLLYAEWALDEKTQEKDRNFLFGQAWGHLERTVALSSDRETARRKLVEMAIAIGRYQNAKEHLQMALLQQHPEDPELWEQLAVCQSRMGEHDAARKSYEKAIRCDPGQVSSYLPLAILLRSQFSQPKEADQLMDQLVEANPDSARAHYFRAQYLLGSGMGEEALGEVEKALELDSNDVEILYLAARCYLVTNKIDDARRCAAKAVEQRPNLFVLYTTLADIESRAGKREESLAVLERGLRNTDRDIRILYAMAHLLIDMNQIERARKIIEELKPTNLQRPMIELLNARIEYVQGHWLAARRGFEKVRGAGSVANMTTLIDRWIADCYGRLGNREMQERVLLRAQSASPTDSRVITELVDISMRQGDYDKAIEAFQALVRSGRASPQSAPVYARMLLMQNLRLPPERRNWSAVDQALEMAEKNVPDSPMIPILRAEALIGQNRSDEAEQLLREARDKNPDQIAYWRAIASLAYRNENWEEAEKILDETEKKFGDTPEQRLARAQHILRRSGSDAADGLRELAENADSFNEEQRLELWGGLLGAAMQINNDQLIGLFAEKILEKQPDNVGIYYMLFDRALGKNDRPEMEKYLKEIERITGQGSYWLVGNAILLYIDAAEESDPKVKEASLTQALEMLDKASELREEWSRIPVVEAGILDALGKPELALEKYRRAFDMGERNPNSVKRAIHLLVQSQQFAEADHMVRQLERELGALSIDIYRMGAEVAMRMDDHKRALDMTRKGAANDSENYIDHLWLGQMLGTLGSRAKAANEENAAELLADAEKAFRRAVELAPELPQTWVPLVRFLAIVGEAQKAETAVEEAKLKIPEKEAPLALAQCYDAMGNLDEAEKQYEEAVAAAPKNVGVAKVVAAFYARVGKMPQAEAQLQKIIDGKVEGEPADAAWARRQLALITAARGGYNNLMKARKLIEDNLAGPEASVLDRQFLARLDASDPQAAHREQARLSFEKMLEEQAASPQDQLALAQMYESAGEWIKAGNVYRNLVTAHPREPRFLVAYIEALFRHNEISSVEMYLNRLQGLAPDWFGTLSLRADWLCARNQGEAAFDLMKKFADAPDLEAKERDVRLRLAADKLNQLGQKFTKPEEKPLADKFFEQAETYLREYVKAEPARNLRLAVFLGARGKMDEAVDLLEKSLDLNSPGDFSKAGIFLSQNPMSEELLKRMNAATERGIKKFNRHPAMLLALAELRTRQMNYDEAEAFYREVLDKYPDHAVAMNNLSVLLALQGVKLDEALELVDKAIEIAGPLGSMLDSRASVYMARGEPDKALADLADSIADSESPVRLFHQAQALHQAGRTEEAKSVLQKAFDKQLSPEMLQPLELPAFEELRKALM